MEVANMRSPQTFCPCRTIDIARTDHVFSDGTTVAVHAKTGRYSVKKVFFTDPPNKGK